MAFKLAEAFVELNARGFSGVDQKIDRITVSFAGMGSMMSRVTGMVPGLTAALGALGAGASVAGMIKMAADAEQTALSFEVMTGSAEAAATMVQRLEQLGAATPFEFPGLAEAAKTMMSFGVAARDVVPAVSRLGDIAQGNNPKLQSLALVFGQVASAGRLTGQDLLQFINAGFNPLNEIAKRTGESMEQLRDRMSDGKVSFAEVRQAVIDATSAGGQFYQMNARQSATLAGQWSTLKDEIGRALRSIGEGLVKSFDLKGAIQNLTSFAKVFQSEIVPWITAGAQSAASFAASMAKWGKTIVSVASGLAAVKAAQIAFTAAAVAYQVVQKGMITGEAILAALRQNWVGLAAAAAIGIGTYIGVSHTLNKTLAEVQESTAAAAAETSELNNDMTDFGPIPEQAAEAPKSIADEIRRASEELAILKGEATKTELQLQRLRDEGADAGEVQQLGAILLEIETAKKLKEERESLQREAEQLKKSGMTKGQELAAAFDEISKLLSQGLLSPEEAKRAREAAKTDILGDLIPKSDLDTYRERVNELRTLLEQGKISQEEFTAGLENAKPARVAAILEEIKSPIEKYKQAMEELQSFRNEGLLNDEQLAKAQKKLNDQFEKEHQRRMGLTSVSQHWANIQSSIVGKSNSFASEIEKSIAKTGESKMPSVKPPVNPARGLGEGKIGTSAERTVRNNAMERMAVAIERIAEQALGSGQGLKVRNQSPSVAG